MADDIDENTPETEVEDTNALEMSDDDFLKMEEPAAPGDNSDDTNPEPETNTDADNGTAEGTGDANEVDTDDVSTESTSTTDSEETASTREAELDDTSKDDIPETKIDDNTEEGKTKQTVLSEDVNKDTGYDQLMAPFKANGELMQVKSIDDARTLMKMGANYSKKMDGIAPHRKTLKLLDKHDLLEPEKLNYLIDLSQKNPEAIKKLLKDSGTNPLDIDLEGDNDYVPEQRTVSDAEIQIDEVLEDIQDSQHYGRTLNVLSKEWDEASRSVVSKNPQIIKTINDHMENGLYDQVAAAVAYERRLGKLAGVPDFEAYKQMGDHMNTNNLFKQATQSQAAPTANPQTTQTEQSTQQTPNTTVADKDAKRKARKAAASSSTSKSKATPDKGSYDPLNMSDEDFLKFDSSSYV